MAGLRAYIKMSSDEIQRSLGRIEGMLSPLVTKVTDQETRIRGLERWRWLLAGAFTVLSALVKFYVG